MRSKLLPTALLLGLTFLGAFTVQPANANRRSDYLNNLAMQTAINQRLSAQYWTRVQQARWAQGEALRHGGFVPGYGSPYGSPYGMPQYSMPNYCGQSWQHW